LIKDPEPDAVIKLNPMVLFYKRDPTQWGSLQKLLIKGPEPDAVIKLNPMVLFYKRDPTQWGQFRMWG
jgi:hypothetical protein